MHKFYIQRPGTVPVCAVNLNVSDNPVDDIRCAILSDIAKEFDGDFDIMYFIDACDLYCIVYGWDNAVVRVHLYDDYIAVRSHEISYSNYNIKELASIIRKYQFNGS